MPPGPRVIVLLWWIPFRLMKGSGCLVSFRFKHLYPYYNPACFLKREWQSNKTLLFFKIYFFFKSAQCKALTMLVSFVFCATPAFAHNDFPVNAHFFSLLFLFVACFDFLRALLYHFFVSDIMFSWEKQTYPTMTWDCASVSGTQESSCFLSSVGFEHLFIFS